MTVLQVPLACGKVVGPGQELRDVVLRDFENKDIPALLNYIYRSPAGFIASIGVDETKLPPEAEDLKSLEETICASKQPGSPGPRILAIEVGGRTIGYHSVADMVPGAWGTFHASFWDGQFRGLGVGCLTYPRACAVFMERFRLFKILFKTPIQNVAALRVKEKLGIRCIGSEELSGGFTLEGTRVKVFELCQEELPSVLSRATQLFLPQHASE